MEFLTLHRPPGGVPAPAMPTAPMPPHQLPPESKNPVYTESRAAATAGQTTLLLGGAVQHLPPPPRTPGKRGAILPRPLQPLPGGWDDWQSTEKEEESPKLLLS